MRGSGLRFDMPVLFWEGPYASLSNFSAHNVVFEGVEYMTAEHAYQTSKFQDPAREKIKNAPSAYLAHEYGQSRGNRTENWESKKDATMKEIMRAKLMLHEDVKRLLLSTGNNPIEKNHPSDEYWGIGAKGEGKNMMGKIWMQLREELKQSV